MTLKKVLRVIENGTWPNRLPYEKKDDIFNSRVQFHTQKICNKKNTSYHYHENIPIGEEMQRTQ